MDSSLLILHYCVKRFLESLFYYVMQLFSAVTLLYQHLFLMLKSFLLIIRLVYPHVPAGVCRSPVIKSRDQRPESYTATHSKNCIVYCAEQVAHDLDLISLYFYFVRWNPRWKKYKIWLSVGKQCKQTSSLLLIATVGMKFSSSNFFYLHSNFLWLKSYRPAADHHGSSVL